MASINGISVKNVTTFKGHEGEPCFQGDVFVENKKIGFWSQDSHGAICDQFNFEGPYSDIKLANRVKELNKDKTFYGERPDKSKFSIEYSLEQLFSDLISLREDEKMFKNAVKKGYGGIMLVTDGCHVVAWNLPEAYLKAGNSILIAANEKMIEEEKKKAGFFKEDTYTKHQIKIYRSLKDFNIGTPIKLEDISRNISIDEKVANAKEKSPKGTSKKTSLELER